MEKRVKEEFWYMNANTLSGHFLLGTAVQSNAGGVVLGYIILRGVCNILSFCPIYIHEARFLEKPL